MPKIVFRVQEEAAGWMVLDGTPMGPFIARQQAVDLAIGMVAVLTQAGQDAGYIVVETDDQADRRA